MRLKITLFLLVIMGLYSCQKKLNIKLDIENVPEQNVSLEHFYMDSFVVLENKSVYGGDFSLRTDPVYPSILRIRFDLGKYIFLSIADEDQDISITGNWDNMDRLEIDGSQSTQDLQQFFAGMRTFASSQNAYYQVQEAFKNDASKDSMYNDAKKKAKESKIEYELAVEDYVNSSPYLLNKLFVLNFLNKKTKQYFIDSTLGQLLIEYPDNPELHHAIKQLSPKLESQVKTQGKKATDIKGMSPSGAAVNLSDFLGQYVLVDFWASWCPPCRAENPNMVKLYQKYKDQNFTILGVSLDKKKEPWVQAIKSDHLNWNHSSELLGWQAVSVRDYKVTSIPASFLVDPQGEIIAKNFSLEMLDQKLSQVFEL